MRTRCGTFLLFAFAMIAVLVALAFALLQTTRLATDSGLSAQRIWLAQEAARAGLDHAIENIVRDYAAPGPTTLDGSWHRAFWSLSDTDMNQPSAEDDVRRENPVTGQLYYPGAFAGRARYYEVNYYDRADPGAVRFTGGDAPPPLRNDRLRLNAALKRVAPADPARYRLRYAVVCNDLDGLILVNPALDVDYRDAWKPGAAAIAYAALPADDPYRAGPAAAYADAAFAPDSAGGDPGLGRRLERYACSLYNLLHAGSSDAATARTLHVFRLRGGAGNVAQDDAGWPVTFPTMFRLWTSAAATSRTNFGDPLGVGVGLYRSGAATPALEGGRPLAGSDGSGWDTVGHLLVGPQFSFRNLDRAIAGYENNPFVGGGFIGGAASKLTPFGRAGRLGARSGAADWNAGPSDVPWMVNLLTAPPMSLGSMIYAYLPPGIKGDLAYERYYSYLAPGEYTACVAERPRASTTARVPHKDLFTGFMSPAFAPWPPPSGPAQNPDGTANPLQPVLWPNHYIPDTRPATAVYPGPYASLAQEPDPTLLAVEDTGRWIDADTVNHDGRDVYTGAVLVPLAALPVRKRGGTVSDDFRTAYTTWQLSTGDDKLPATPVADATGIETPMPTATVGAPGTWGYHPEDIIVDTPAARSEHSFFYDMSRAFSTAITILRAHWAVSAYIHPAASFPAGRLAPGEVDSLAGLDRLFLVQLGIDIDHPDSAAVAPSWSSALGSAPYRFGKGQAQLRHNIRSLLAAPGDPLRSGTLSGAMRARAMEMLLNDWRMSFLGASPEYAAAFRPLDFDGDGYAVCNAYAARSAYPDDVAGVAWARRPASGGIGPPPDLGFSLTGCLSLGKSRYYRVCTRGELWDDLLKRTVATTTLETVLAIDANGDADRAAGATGIADDLVVLHQRWYWNRYNALLPTVQP